MSHLPGDPGQRPDEPGAGDPQGPPPQHPTQFAGGQGGFPAQGAGQPGYPPPGTPPGQPGYPQQPGPDGPPPQHATQVAGGQPGYPPQGPPPGQPGYPPQGPPPGQPGYPPAPPQQPGQPGPPQQPPAPQHPTRVPGQPGQPGYPPQQPGQPGQPGYPPQQPGQPGQPGQQPGYPPAPPQQPPAQPGQPAPQHPTRVPGQPGQPGYPPPGPPQQPQQPFPPAQQPAQPPAQQPAQPPTGTGDLTQQLLDTEFWTDEMVAAAGIPVYDIPFVSVGGGIGSFVTVDYLRIAGVPPEQMRVLTNRDTPWQTYEYLTRVSQIPRPERIRSDSQSRPDNIWGFPSYALEEFLKSGNPRRLFQVFLEPVFDDFYTPQAGMVFSHMEREFKRIRFDQMISKGQVRMVRRRVGGGYFTILTPDAGTSPTKRVAFRSKFVHLAIGYPGLRFLPDLQDFRTKYKDYNRVINAYESHEHVYEDAKTKPHTVVVRGGGVVASRVLQRLMDDRKKFNLQTRIVHIFRTYYAGPHGKNIWNRRKGKWGFAYQGFNYPKSVWGGQLKKKMRNLEGEARAQAYKEMGGTNTPYRRYWQKQMREGREGGWYVSLQGTVSEVMKLDDGQLLSRVQGPQGASDVVSDYIIDCTGLEADISEHRVIADLLDKGGAGRNPLGRLDVERTFEVRGSRSGDGVLYASGSATLGGYFPGVDTFLGLQISAQEICDDLAKNGLCKKIGPFRSLSQWFKWARNKQI